MEVRNYMHLFPFQCIPSCGAHIALWGLGMVGDQYLRQCEVTEYCVIDFIIDKNYNSIKACRYPIVHPETLNEEQFKRIDYLVISIKNEREAQEIKKQCIFLGMEEKKIIHDIRVIGISTLVNDRLFSIYKSDYYMNIKKLLRIHTLKHKLIRMGGKNDGGYVMCDDLTGGIAYSFGINDDVSWDNAMANLGYEIFMYDHTIKNLPLQRKEFHFFRRGISGKKIDDLDTLENYIKINNHENEQDMILKLDVEGAEWEVLETISTDVLGRFSQIVVEFHGLFDSTLHRKILPGLRKLNQTHSLVHVHANNAGLTYEYFGTKIADVLECTWVKTGKYEFTDYEVALPLSVDAPNSPYFPEVILGKWNHTNNVGGEKINESDSNVSATVSSNKRE